MSTRRRVSGLVESLRLGQGATYGVLAFLVGYVLTYGVLTIDAEASLDNGGTFELVGMVFYEAQFVDLVAAGPGYSESVTLLAENSTQIPRLGYTLVPICALVGAGFLAARDGGDRTTPIGTAVAMGISIIVGYLPFVLVGTLLFEERQTIFETTVSTGPETGSALLFAGLCFPIVCGALGGAIAGVTLRE